MAPRTDLQQPRRQRQDALRRLLDELARSQKTWHVIEEGLCARGEGRLVLRLSADKSAPRLPPRRRKGDETIAAAWYFRYTDPKGKRPWIYIGVRPDPQGGAGSR